MSLDDGAGAVGDGEGGLLGHGVLLAVEEEGGRPRAVGGVGRESLGGGDGLVVVLPSPVPVGIRGRTRSLGAGLGRGKGEAGEGEREDGLGVHYEIRS